MDLSYIINDTTAFYDDFHTITTRNKRIPVNYELTLLPAFLIELILVINLYHSHHKLRNKRFTIVNAVLFYQLSYQIFFPAIYGVIEGYPWESFYSIAPEHLFLVYAIELLSVCFWLIGFYRLHYIRLNAPRLLQIPKISRNETNILLFIFILFSQSLFFLRLFSKSQFDTYQSTTAYDETNLGGNVGTTNIPSVLFLPISTIIGPGGVVGSAILATREANSKFEQFLKVISWFSILSYPVYGLIIGTRSSMIGPFIMILLCGFFQGNKRTWMFVIMGIIIIGLLAPVMGGDYRSFLTVTSLEKSGIVTRLLNIYEFTKSSLNLDSISRLWQEIGARFDDGRLSAGLIKRTLRGEPAGHRPILSALCAPIPRFLWTNKPAPGSSDGTMAGLAAFVVWRETIGREWGLSGGFTSGSHAFWELSFVGVIISGLFSGFFARRVLEATKRHGEIGLIVWILSMRPFTFLANLWIPEIIRIFWQSMLPFIIIAWCFKWVNKIKRKSHTKCTPYLSSLGAKS